jgi:large subunit ribosomal protein L17
MHHRKHNHILGVKKEHRLALFGNLAAALIQYGRIETTLAKALRTFIEKIVTFAKRAIARVRK